MAVDTRPLLDPAEWAPERTLGKEAEMRRFQTCIGMIPPEARSLLDVGTGIGNFLHLLEQQRPELRLMGLERLPHTIDQKLCRAEVVRGSIDALPFGAGEFDVVTAMEVIEHLPYAVYFAALEELQRVAREHVLISVPFREQRAMATCGYCGCSFNPYYHVRTFDEGTMRALLPAFDCVRLEPVLAEDVALAPSLKRLFRKVRGSVWHPAYAICPQCGFQPARLHEEGAPPPAPAAEGLGRRARRLLPKRMTAKWIVGLYRRR